MQMSCPCCSRTLNVYPQHKSTVPLTKHLIEESLNAYDNMAGLDTAENGFVDQSLVTEDEMYEDQIGPMLDSTEQTINCLCGTQYVLSFPIMLTGIKIPVAHARKLFEEDLQETLDILDRHTYSPAPTPWNRPLSTIFHGASVSGCEHNYVFQRRINGTNEAEVKCTRCGNTKRM